MFRAIKKLWLPLFFAGMLCGCIGIGSVPKTPCRVITRVTVIYNNGPIHVKRTYTKDNKMQPILNYLRIIDPYGKAEENPEALAGSDISIILNHSDGYQKIYRQKADRYLMGTDGIWRKINPNRAQLLSQILGKQSSDPQQRPS